MWTYSAYANDSWRLNNRLTLNLGLRFDRYRVFLPEQTHPPGRFNATLQTFPAVDNLIDWNVVAPRIGLVHDLSGDGKTIAKVSYSQYWLGPGTDLGFNANPNSNQWWRRHTWSDLNGSGVWEPGEEGRLVGSRGGVAIESLDPDSNFHFSERSRVGRARAVCEYWYSDGRRVARRATALHAPERELAIRRVQRAAS